MSELHIPNAAVRVLARYTEDIGGAWSGTAEQDVRDISAPVVAAVLRDLVDDLVEVRKQCREDGEVQRAVGIGDALEEVRRRIPDGQPYEPAVSSAGPEGDQT